MGPELYFFDIPVYRLDENSYYKKRENYINKLLNNNKEFYEKNPASKQLCIEVANKDFGGVWQYNEIIGFIRLYILGVQIRGEYFVNDVKKHCKTRKKRFVLSTDKLVPEINFPLPNDNQSIYQTIFLYLKYCEKELPGRFIDSSIFKRVGIFIDWVSLISEINN